MKSFSLITSAGCEMVRPRSSPRTRWERPGFSAIGLLAVVVEQHDWWDAGDVAAQRRVVGQHRIAFVYDGRRQDDRVRHPEAVRAQPGRTVGHLEGHFGQTAARDLRHELPGQSDEGNDNASLLLAVVVEEEIIEETSSDIEWRVLATPLVFIALLFFIINARRTLLGQGADGGRE